MFFVGKLGIFPNLTELVLAGVVLFKEMITFLFASPSLWEDFSTNASIRALISRAGIFLIGSKWTQTM